MSGRFPRGLEMLSANSEAKSLIGVDAGAAIHVVNPHYEIDERTVRSLDSHMRLAERSRVTRDPAVLDRVVLATARNASRCEILGMRGWSDGAGGQFAGFAVCAPSQGTLECASSCLAISESSEAAGEHDVVLLRAGDRMLIPDGPFALLGLDPDGPSALFHLPIHGDRLRFVDKLPPLLIEKETSRGSIRLLTVVDESFETILEVTGPAAALIAALGSSDTIASLAKHGVHVRNHHHHDAVDATAGNRILINRSLGDWSNPTRWPHAGDTLTSSRFLERWERLQREKADLVKTLSPTNDRKFRIVIEGAGDWVRDAYQPYLRQLKNDHKLDLDVTYVHTGDTKLTDLEPQWEWELNKIAQRDKYDRLAVDLVFVVTPDHTHCEIAKGWIETEARRAPLIFIEKPFDSDSEHVQELIRIHAAFPECNVLGLDHYLMYERPLIEKLPEVIEELGGAITNVDFYLCETGADKERLGTLQFGMTLDLLPHFLALLEKYTDLATLDDVIVDERSRYADIPFENETYSRTQFTAGWAGDDGVRFDCRAAVGKGLRDEVKYIEFRGVNKKMLRIDFKGNDLPRGHMFMHESAAPTPSLADPYYPERKLHIIASPALGAEGVLKTGVDRYLPLLKGLVDGNAEEAVKSTLLMADAANLVNFLDRLRTFMSGDSGTAMTEYPSGTKTVSAFPEVDL